MDPAGYYWTLRALVARLDDERELSLASYKFGTRARVLKSATHEAALQGDDMRQAHPLQHDLKEMWIEEQLLHHGVSPR